MNPDVIIPTCKTPYEIAPIVCCVEGTALDCKVIATCHKESAAINRNRGLEAARTPIVIMIDDDIAGFYDGWAQDMIKPLEENPNIVMVSARLLGRDGLPGPMMFSGDSRTDCLADIPRCPTACIAFRNDGTRFDEEFIGSGFEDDDFCAQLARKYPGGRFVINNRVKLIHVNEMKNQHGRYYEHNKKHFEKNWRTIRNNTIRVDEYWNIPKILHFVWIGSELPAFAKANIEEFRRLNPDFRIMVHNESILAHDLKSDWNKIDEKYEHALAIRSDLLRLSVLRIYGGWYFDTDFWPLISIKEMCEQMRTYCHDQDPYERLVCFVPSGREIAANGAIGCQKNCKALDLVVKDIHAFPDPHPGWGSFGTAAFGRVLRNTDTMFDLPINLIIPFIGKADALDCMCSREKILATKEKGAWAIHFEMQTSTDVPEGLCTIQNTDKTNGSMKTSLKAKKKAAILSAERLTA